MSDSSGPQRPRDRLTLSIHVPKTAGTRFSDVLRHHYGSACAFYYGADDERTHPDLRVPLRDFSGAHFDALAENGIEVVHGHMPARALMGVFPDPKQYWLFLREPIEHALSRYHFVRDRDPEAGLTKAIASGGGTLESYIALPRSQNFQSQYIQPLDIREVGFVGVTEMFEAMLTLLDLSDTSKKANVNAQKPIAPLDEREILSPHLTKDLALYSLALELAVRRLGLRDINRLSRYKANVARLARRFGAQGGSVADGASK
ncbi:MAG: hypothetical protein AAGF45_02315 [Pseudomonadota bacterium]